MEYKEIVGLSPEEVRKRLIEERKELFDSRMKNSLGQLSNPMAIRKARRNIARLKTVVTAASRAESEKKS